jgi:hypothetical protein
MPRAYAAATTDGGSRWTGPFSRPQASQWRALSRTGSVTVPIRFMRVMGSCSPISVPPIDSRHLRSTTEHLGTTDRRTTMFRKEISGGIHTVRANRHRPGLCREPGAVIPTYCNDTVVGVAPAATPSADKELLRKTGRRLAENYLRDPPLSVGR